MAVLIKKITPQILQCLYYFIYSLARVLLTYVSADFREIDDIRQSFEEDFKSYNKLMEEVAKKPIVSKCCLLPERRKMLKDYKGNFCSYLFKTRLKIFSGP